MVDYISDKVISDSSIIRFYKTPTRIKKIVFIEIGNFTLFMACGNKERPSSSYNNVNAIPICFVGLKKRI